MPIALHQQQLVPLARTDGPFSSSVVSLSALQIALELLYLGVPVLTTSQALSMYEFCFLVFLPLL